MQRCEHFVPGLRARPWWSCDDVPLAGELEANTTPIQEEFDDLVLAGWLRLHPQSAGGPQRSLTDRPWNIVDLVTGGRLEPKTSAVAPVTARLLGTSHEVLAARRGLAYFSVLAPGAHVAAHCGPTNTRLRLHLGLHIPEGAAMRVGRETRRWETGRCLVFDDSFEHEVWNPSARHRAVLLVDVAHPDWARSVAARTGPERATQVSSSTSRAAARRSWMPAGEPDAALSSTIATMLGVIDADRRSRLVRTSDVLRGTADGSLRAAARAVHDSYQDPRRSTSHRRVRPTGAGTGLWEELYAACRTGTIAVDPRSVLDAIGVCQTWVAAHPAAMDESRRLIDDWSPSAMQQLRHRLTSRADPRLMLRELAHADADGTLPLGQSAPVVVSALRDLGRRERTVAITQEASSTRALMDRARRAAVRARDETSTTTWTGRHQAVVTIRLHGAICGCMRACGDSASAAVEHAAERAVADRRFRARLSADELSTATLEIWLLREETEVSHDTLSNTFDPGRHGLTVQQGPASAFYLPAVPLESGVGTLAELCARLGRKAGVDQSPSAAAPRYRTTLWHHHLENPNAPGGVVSLRRLRPPMQPVTASAVRRRFRLSITHLLNGQAADGRYRARHHPGTGRGSHDGSLVRQAGTAYGMAAAIRWIDEPELPARMVGSAVACVDHLFERTHSPQGRTRTLPLGATALLLATVQQLDSARFASTRRRLTRDLVRAQRPDGSFRCSTDARHDLAQANFYPGQALLALSTEAAAGNDGATRAIALGFQFYRQRFDAGVPPMFVPWQTAAWCAVAAAVLDGAALPVPVESVTALVFSMIETLLAMQIMPGTTHRDLAGAITVSAGAAGFQTACYTEAVLLAAALAHRVGHTDRARRYAESGELGLRYVHRLQIMPETAPLFEEPRFAIGGTTISLADLTVRCDAAHHAAAAHLAALDLHRLTSLGSSGKRKPDSVGSAFF